MNVLFLQPREVKQLRLVSGPLLAGGFSFLVNYSRRLPLKYAVEAKAGLSF